MQLLKFSKSFLNFRRSNLTWLHLNCARVNDATDPNENLIISNTVVCTNHLTPELRLRLITPECKLWYAKSTESEFPSDPFWGIYWPGGEALARYILDHKEVFKKKRILDIGSGSGACALAAAKCEADFVVANDIDPFSISAIHINARLNNLIVHTNGDDIIGEDIDSLVIKVQDQEFHLTWDVVLIGDMFYDTEFSTKLFRWLVQLVKNGKLVLVGDPGRHALKDLESMKDLGTMIKIKDYTLVNKDHNGFSQASVFKVSNSKISPILHNHTLKFLSFRLKPGDALSKPTGNKSIFGGIVWPTATGMFESRINSQVESKGRGDLPRHRLPEEMTWE